MGWTDERVASLKKIWLEGHSASQIAKQLGGVTRNAVIGKVHRLGLSGRATPSQPQRPALRITKPVRPAAPAAPARRVEAAVAPTISAPQMVVERRETPGSATVLTLGACICKWPIGDPASTEFTFCGRRASQGPYCGEHAQVAYQPAPKKANGAKRSDAAELARSLRRYI